MSGNLRINSDRLWESLMRMAEIGATAKGGSRRLALSDEDRAGRDLFCQWCEAIGCSLTVDQLGNIFARRLGRNPDRAPVAAGSHLDTQPHGGKFDGVYGVLAGLEVLRTLHEHRIETEAPLEVAVWTNEEGARFAPSMIASAVFAGVYGVDFARSITDREGTTMGEELERIGYAGEEVCGDHPFEAFFEAHIEQGPVLEREGHTIGVVENVQGLRWYDVTVIGQDAHAGSTPMAGRRNALVGAAAMIEAVDELAHAHAPYAVATVGELSVSPNSRNTIPGEVGFTIDLRHPDDEIMSRMDEEMRWHYDEIAARLELKVEVDQVSHTPAVAFDPACIAAIRDAAKHLELSNRSMLSGAGHDACHISRVAPTGMIFVPCAGGLSHNEEESATPEDLAAGCNVLLHAMLSRAG